MMMILWKIRDNQVLCQLSVKTKLNVSIQLNFRLFVSCQIKFLAICQLSVNPIQTLIYISKALSLRECQFHFPMLHLLNSVADPGEGPGELASLHPTYF